jgi:hypothetical protein
MQNATKKLSPLPPSSLSLSLSNHAVPRKFFRKGLFCGRNGCGPARPAAPAAAAAAKAVQTIPPEADFLLAGRGGGTATGLGLTDVD